MPQAKLVAVLQDGFVPSCSIGYDADKNLTFCLYALRCGVVFVMCFSA